MPSSESDVVAVCNPASAGRAPFRFGISSSIAPSRRSARSLIFGAAVHGVGAEASLAGVLAHRPRAVGPPRTPIDSQIPLGVRMREK